jgi:hypothetical protein
MIQSLLKAAACRTFLLTLLALASFGLSAQGDVCADATNITDGSTVTGTTVGASNQITGFCGTGDGSGGVVWYSYTPAASGTATFSLCGGGTNYDSRIKVFSGTCGALVCVGGNDDFCGAQSQTAAAVTGGTQYFVVISGFGAAQGNYSLATTFLEPATNGECEDAIVVTNGETVEGSTAGASPDVAPTCGTTNGTGGGVWYSFTPDITGNATFSLCGSAFDTRIRVYTGACDALECVGGNDDACGLQSSITVDAVAGTEYLVLVHGFGTASGNFTLTVTAAIPPENDDCEDAEGLVIDGVVPGTTNGAAADNLPGCGGFNEGTGGTVWYSYTTGVAGSLTVNTCNDASADFDTQIAVFTGSCAALSCTDGNDDFCGSQSQVTTIQVGPGEDFFVAVTGFGANAGDFEIFASFDTCTANFVCVTDATIIIGDDGTTTIDSSFVLDEEASLCIGDQLTIDVTDFTCADLGVVPVTATFTPGAGSLAEPGTCTVMVTVADETGPVIAVNFPVSAQIVDDMATITIEELAVITDNCTADADIIVTASPLTFSCLDDGIVTVTATDASGNTTTTTIQVFLIPENANAACFNQVNLTLNDDCQGLVIPSMVIVGQTNCLSEEMYDIVVQDDDPSNGPIIDGCGRFVYTVNIRNGIGRDFSGFDAADWTIESNESGDQVARSMITADTLAIGARGGNTTVAGFSISASYMFTDAGQASFDYVYNGIDTAADGTTFDEAIIVYDFDGVMIEEVLTSESAASGSSTVNVFPGYTLVLTINDDGFAPALNGGDGLEFSMIALTNFEFVSAAIGDYPFTGCWGFVNAEDKTPPAIVSTPGDVSLLCVDFETEANNLTTLPATVSRCYRVYSNNASAQAATTDPATTGGATVRGTMAAALSARLRAGTNAPVVPIFTDGCTEQIEVCVNDVVTFGEDVNCDDITITRTFTATEVANCPSASGEGNPPVVTSYNITFVRPTLANLPAGNTLPVAEFSRCGIQNPTPADYPAPRAGDFPSLTIDGRSFLLTNGQSVCNIGVAFADGEAIETCPYTYKFVRTYTVIDWCAPETIRTFTQLVKVGDETAPTFVGPNGPVNSDGDLIYGTNIGNVCASIIRLDNVSVVDDCSGTDVTVTATIFPSGNLTGIPIGVFTVVPGGQPELSTPIPAGRHLLRYDYKDLCGNRGTRDYFFVVEDQMPPTAICEDGLNISISGSTSNGYAILKAADLDAGSYDDCSGITRTIARVNNNNLEIGSYDAEIRLTCADVGTVRVGLRIEDESQNINFCWLEILVEDKLAPSCVAPAATTINCDVYNETLPSNIMEASDEMLNILFGEAAGVDNCNTVITQSISGDVNSCGVGSFRREFVSTDDAGLTNTNSCFQEIEVIGVHDYRITFPVDVSGLCAVVPEYDGLEVDELACDLITSTLDIDTLRTQLAGDECFKLRATYDVVNWCEYNSLGEPYIIARDADGALNRSRRERDLEEDVIYLNVIPRNTSSVNDDFAFITLLTDRNFNAGGTQNDQPVGTNYGVNDSRGFFRYTQFIKIYDEVTPEITFTPYTDCFVGNDANCATTVELEFTATDECSEVDVLIELDPFYNSANSFQPVSPASVGVGVSLSTDGEGNFTLTATNVPAGNHAIRVRASDGCGNLYVQIIEFCVIANRTPTPICIQTLTVVLADDGIGGGIAEIWGSDFIASPIFDCEGNPVTKYALYRADDPEATIANARFNPPATTGIYDIDCADFENGTVRVRLFAFDEVGSEPNFCEVVVEVQDNAGFCSNAGDLSGQITTDNNEMLEGVAVTLTGGNAMDATTMTDANGNFDFVNLPLGNDYTIQPAFGAAPNMRNIKTSDLTYMIGRILGTLEFDSPYDFVAADVTRDMDLNIFDVIATSQLILGIQTEFAGGNWVFVSNEAIIPMSNPYGAAFPEVFNVNDLDGDLRNIGFVGVELGNPFHEAGRSAQVIKVNDAQLEAGQVHTMILDGSSLAGFQGTIELAAGLELVAADYLGEGGMNLNRAGEGLIAIAVRDNATVTLEVRATTSGLLSELVSLTDAITIREGVTMNGASNSLSLSFGGLMADGMLNSLEQNMPNPVADATVIAYNLVAAGTATLTIQDVQGRTIMIRKMEGIVGRNVTTINASDLAASGVLTYTLTSGDFTASRKMVVVR